MIIAIAGISGFTGSELKRFFENLSYKVIGIPRSLTMDSEKSGELATILSRADVVINLSGAPILRRHTRKNRQLLWESRIYTTRHLVNAMKICSLTPQLFISASATGIYKAGQLHDEFENEIDNSFLGQLCVQWEHEANKANELNIRTVNLRSGIILGKNGGVAKKLYPLFKAGLGAVILPSDSAFPWIHISDFTEICHFFVQQTNSAGAYNLISNQKTTQKDFAKAFAHALKRPLFFAVPSLMLRIVFGKGADILNKNPFVHPKRLSDEGYTFQFSDIQEAMKDLFQH
jgi:uncharacterized protein